MIPEGWKYIAINNLLEESHIVGSNGAISKKITVKLYGKGVFEKQEKRAGSPNTNIFVESLDNLSIAN